MSKRKQGRGEGVGSELEEALVGRLRQLDWPKPTAEVKQRCLDDILDRMSEIKKQEPNASTRTQFEYRARGFGQRHSLTRRVGAIAQRQPFAAPQRPVRVATVLW
jgi:hypothetical protein